MSNPHDVQVRMCEIAVSSGEDAKILRATLGSCVGIGLLWRSRGTYGLAHCLLPEPMGVARGAAPAAPQAGNGAKYVIEALPKLLAMMHADGAAEGEIEAVLAGGANMMHHRTTIHEPIGELNVRMARQMLANTRLKVVHVDVGGECGRQLTIDCEQHHYAVRHFSRTALPQPPSSAPSTSPSTSPSIGYGVTR
ncbi:chemotaxis protein CheD [Paraburkholderia unamae]|uniref:chemotaxis protein CheD n=1 Tax=Paraburkholderia unamae TaxID=219649 RepID=UPI000DC4D6B8|nr:chemotaxis protein CheD [Paraburkholderia unamae]RAR65150.1 chemotaxis protein CheD [Paraburkholderia unamae]